MRERDRTKGGEPVAVRLRRAHSLVTYWEDGDLVVENYLSHTSSTVSPGVVQLLSQLDGSHSRTELCERFRSVPDVEDLIDRLVEQTILVEEASDLAERDALVDDVWEWGHDVRFFHYATKHVDYEPSVERQRQGLVELARRNPPPSPFRDFDAPSVQLDDTFNDRAGGVWDPLETRRTVRDYARDPVSFADFSALVQWTWGHTSVVRVPEVGDHLLKTSPSGGARHPIEVYPIVHRVEDVPPGVYHYAVEENALERLAAGEFEAESVDLCGHQDWVGDAAAVFLMTAALERSMWKYDHSRAYRVVLLDAGHLGQTFCLVATALGLGPFTTAATLDQEIEELIGLDGVSEVPVYATAVGIPSVGSGETAPEPL